MAESTVGLRSGVAFTTDTDGDQRDDGSARSRVARSLGVSDSWATVNQVHGSKVEVVDRPGVAGEADGLVTRVAGLPLAVFTADCAGVVLEGDGAVGVAHAGWRGAVAGVVAETASAVGAVHTATIGPHIRSCCFEVGAEVAERFPNHVSTTTWGTVSVDLAGFIRSQLPDVAVVDFEACTRCGDGWFSHRRDGDSRRLAAIAWIGGR